MLNALLYAILTILVLTTLFVMGRTVVFSWRQRGVEPVEGAPVNAEVVAEHLAASGWNTTARPRLEVFAEYGRPLAATEDTAALRNSLSVTAIKN